jgi:hypothetical protein
MQSTLPRPASRFHVRTGCRSVDGHPRPAKSRHHLVCHEECPVSTHALGHPSQPSLRLRNHPAAPCISGSKTNPAYGLPWRRPPLQTSLDLVHALPPTTPIKPGISPLRPRPVERTPVAIRRHHAVRLEQQTRRTPCETNQCGPGSPPRPCPHDTRRRATKSEASRSARVRRATS